MAQDPLGLVYTGQDGTGAAFKAPWTSYDPYSAEVRRGAMLGQIEALKQKKKEADDAEYFKATAGATSNWDLQNTGKLNYWNNRLQSQLTKAYQQNQGAITPQVQEMLNRAKIGSAELKATSDAQGKAREETIKLISSPNADNNFNTSLTRQNIGVFDNPYAAPKSIYPEIQPQLASYEERIRLANRDNPFIDDKLVKYMAEDAWRANEGKEFLAPIEHRSFAEKVKALQDLRNIEESKFTKSGQGQAYTDFELKKYRPEIAKSLVANDFATDHAWRRTISDEWANSPEKDKYANPLEYAQAKLLPHLLVDEVKSTSRNPQDYSSKWGVSVPNDLIVNPVVGKKLFHQIGTRTIDGQGNSVKKEGEGFNETVTHNGVSFLRDVSGKDRGIETKVTGQNFWKQNDITNKVPQTGEADFEFVEAVKLPTLSEPVTIKKSQISGLKDFLGYDVKELVKTADANGNINIDAVNMPLFDKAVNTLRALGFGDKLVTQSYAYGTNEVPEADSFGETKLTKNKGVYYLLDEVEDNLDSYLNASSRSILDASTPDRVYSRNPVRSTNGKNNQTQGQGKSKGETYGDFKSRTGLGYAEWNNS